MSPIASPVLAPHYRWTAKVVAVPGPVACCDDVCPRGAPVLLTQYQLRMSSVDELETVCDVKLAHLPRAFVADIQAGALVSREGSVPSGGTPSCATTVWRRFE